MIISAREFEKSLETKRELRSFLKSGHRLNGYRSITETSFEFPFFPFVPKAYLSPGAIVILIYFVIRLFDTGIVFLFHSLLVSNFYFFIFLEK